MRLTLINFRCYRGVHTFDIEDSGITLINGHSGIGKTTLLMAIYFVITGNCPSKVITDGEDTCKVEFFYENKIFCRTRRPNRVVVTLESKETLEDDLAQQYLNRLWGKHFEITSYIQQQYQKTFLYQSPTEKLEILEHLCFTDDEFNPDELKKKCTVLYKKINADYLLTKGRFESISNVLKGTETSTAPEVIKPVLDQDRKRMMQQLERIKQEEERAVEANSFLERIEELSEKLDSMKKQEDAIVLPEYTREQLENNLSLYQQWANIPEDKQPWQKYSKQECEEMMADYKRDIELHKEYAQLMNVLIDLPYFETEIKKLETSKKLLLSFYEGEYECPCCKNAVCLINEKLVPLSSTEQDRKYIDAEQKRSLLDEFNQKLCLFKQEIEIRNSFLPRKAELESLIDTTEKLQDLEKDHLWVIDYYDYNMSDELQNVAFGMRKKRLQEDMIAGLDRETTQQMFEKYRQKERLVELQENYIVIRNNVQEKMRKLQAKDLSIVRKERKSLEESLKEMETQAHQYEIYQIKQAQYEKYAANIAEFERLQASLKKLERQMNAVLELKQIILKTESEIILGRITEISELVNQFTATMFSDPITVDLQMSKKTQTQNEKVQVQLEVYYKNMKCDIGILSGGEQARLNLAFILAFAYVFKAPLLMLDECTSNLDSELTETVIEQIGNVGIPKVIMIAHQVVEGNFKQILNVK